MNRESLESTRETTPRPFPSGSFRIPFFSSFLHSLGEFDTAQRKFFAFNFFNVVSWQCLMGHVMVLFARSINMPPSLVGFLISFLPLSMTIVVLTAPLVAYYGAKRVMFSAWFVRNLLTCSVFAMPWVMARWGERAGWYLLIGSTLGFCVVRAFGAGGWFPWLHEILPEGRRGAYFSMEQTIVHFVNIAIMFGQAFLLGHDPTVNQFLLIYGIGIAAGFLSLVWMWRVPGGHGERRRMSLLGSLESYRDAIENREFVRFVLMASVSFSCISWLSSSVVLYLREILALPSERIMMYMAAGSVGIMLTIRYWGRFADRSGSGRAMFKTLTGHAAAALLFLTLLPGAAWTPYAAALAIMCASIFASAFFMASHRAMLGYIRDAGSISYTNLWMLLTSLSMGLTPIFVGWVIEWGGLTGFRVCFLVAGVVGVFCAVACRVIVSDGAPVELSLVQLMNPAIPLRVLARVVWITVGLDETNRNAPAPAPKSPQPQRHAG